MKITRIIALLTASMAMAGCAQDKMMHAAAGASVAVVTTKITGSPVKGCLAALGVGIAKEAWDATGRGTVEAADIAATSIGCSVSYAF